MCLQAALCECRLCKRCMTPVGLARLSDHALSLWIGDSADCWEGSHCLEPEHMYACKQHYVNAGSAQENVEGPSLAFPSQTHSQARRIPEPDASFPEPEGRASAFPSQIRAHRHPPPPPPDHSELQLQPPHRHRRRPFPPPPPYPSPPPDHSEVQIQPHRRSRKMRCRLCPC
jgi:hypothetical protein